LEVLSVVALSCDHYEATPDCNKDCNKPQRPQERIDEVRGQCRRIAMVLKCLEILGPKQVEGVLSLLGVGPYPCLVEGRVCIPLLFCIRGRRGAFICFLGKQVHVLREVWPVPHAEVAGACLEPRPNLPLLVGDFARSTRVICASIVARSAVVVGPFAGGEGPPLPSIFRPLRENTIPVAIGLIYPVAVVVRWQYCYPWRSLLFDSSLAPGAAWPYATLRAAIFVLRNGPEQGAGLVVVRHYRGCTAVVVFALFTVIGISAFTDGNPRLGSRGLARMRHITGRLRVRL